ncbi:MAG: hypothetical protein U0798_17880 [Gemmataceae bacterium]
MLADKIQAGFPDGIQIPADMRRLCDFSDANGGSVSGCFEWEMDGKGEAIAWFGGDEAVASQFAVFGRGPDGSLYALWLHNGTDTERAPVVLLDSENSENKVIANDVREFLKLLAIGYEEPGRYPTLEPEDPDSASTLREWLSKEFGLTAPETGTEIEAVAQKQQPDLAKWIRSWQEQS